MLHNKGMTTLDTSPLTGPPLHACLSHLVLLVSRSALQLTLSSVATSFSGGGGGGGVCVCVWGGGGYNCACSPAV